ncbi:CMRF35-like molecule 5 [Megalobrama amblycephala]|uniref:CMRF35-like molecule 5 n=1 Tax=Megalobrama amblycephala TaxID=75352 RepID=UPI0020147133|nr:CMRF35-like molecule 5 [Megalobrama amblycephala]
MILIGDHKLLIFNLLLIMSVVACEMKILTFTAYEGGKVEIWCPYESGYETHKKYLCRGKCKVLDKDIPVESGSAKDERFSLTDNTTTHIFTVTITDPRTEDQGQYWCAVKRTGFLKKDLYTEIHLEIKHVTSESPKPTTTVSDHSSKPATADTASNRPVTSVFPSSSSSSSSSTSSAILMLSSSNNAASSKPEQGFSMMVMLMVVGILTGFGFSLFMYFRWRQKKEVKLNFSVTKLSK